MAKSTSAVKSKQVDFVLENKSAATADFDGGDVSPFGGLALLSLVEGATQYLSGAARYLKDCRVTSQVKHKLENLLKQVVLLTAAGYPDGIDSNFFKADKVLKFCLGWNPDGNQDAASQPSISRFLINRSKRDLLLRSADKAFARKFGEKMFEGNSKKKHELLREISAQPTKDRRNAYAILDERQIRKLGEFRHRAGNGMGENDKRIKRRWKKFRRVISLARSSDKGLKRRYLVTSLEGFTPEHLYDEIYSLRRKAELCIRNFKYLGAARLNNHEANSNQFKLLIYGLVYNLFHLLRQELPPSLRSISAETIIHEFARIAVQVKVSTRRIWLRYTSSYRHTNSLIKMIRRLITHPEPA